jgi:hypothetical protein
VNPCVLFVENLRLRFQEWRTRRHVDGALMNQLKAWE